MEKRSQSFAINNCDWRRASRITRAEWDNMGGRDVTKVEATLIYIYYL